MAEQPPWDVASGGRPQPYVLRYDFEEGRWGTVTARAHLTLFSGQERKPVPIDDRIEVTEIGKTRGLHASATLSADRTSVEVVVSVPAQQSPSSGAQADYRCLLQLRPFAVPRELAAATAAAAGMVLDPRPAASGEFAVVVEVPQQLVTSPTVGVVFDSLTGETVPITCELDVVAGSPPAVMADPATTIRGQFKPTRPVTGWLELDADYVADVVPGRLVLPWRAARFVVGQPGVLPLGDLVFRSDKPDAPSLSKTLELGISTQPVTCRFTVLRHGRTAPLLQTDAEVDGGVLDIDLIADASLDWQGLSLTVEALPAGGELTERLFAAAYAVRQVVAIPAPAAGSTRQRLQVRLGRGPDERTCTLALPVATQAATSGGKLEVRKTGWTSNIANLEDVDGSPLRQLLRALALPNPWDRPAAVTLTLVATCPLPKLKRTIGSGVRIDHADVRLTTSDGRTMPGAYDPRTRSYRIDLGNPEGQGVLDLGEVAVEADPTVRDYLENIGLSARRMSTFVPGGAPGRFDDAVCAFGTHFLEHLGYSRSEVLANQWTELLDKLAITFNLSEGLKWLGRNLDVAFQLRTAAADRVITNIIGFLIEAWGAYSDLSTLTKDLEKAARHQAYQEATSRMDPLRRELGGRATALRDMLEKGAAGAPPATRRGLRAKTALAAQDVARVSGLISEQEAELARLLRETGPDDFFGQAHITRLRAGIESYQGHLQGYRATYAALYEELVRRETQLRSVEGSRAALERSMAALRPINCLELAEDVAQQISLARQVLEETAEFAAGQAIGQGIEPGPGGSAGGLPGTVLETLLRLWQGTPGEYQLAQASVLPTLPSVWTEFGALVNLFPFVDHLVTQMHEGLKILSGLLQQCLYGVRELPAITAGPRAAYRPRVEAGGLHLDELGLGHDPSEVAQLTGSNAVANGTVTAQDRDRIKAAVQARGAHAQQAIRSFLVAQLLSALDVRGDLLQYTKEPFESAAQAAGLLRARIDAYRDALEDLDKSYLDMLRKYTVGLGGSGEVSYQHIENLLDWLFWLTGWVLRVVGCVAPASLIGAPTALVLVKAASLTDLAGASINLGISVYFTVPTLNGLTEAVPLLAAMLGHAAGESGVQIEEPILE